MNSLLQKFRLVVFDFDGTLADTFDDIAVAANHARSCQQLAPLPLADVKRFIGDGIRKLVMGVFGHDERELDEELLQRQIADMRRYYLEHPADHATAYEGVPALLSQLKERGIHRAILSNKPHDLTVRVSEQLRIAAEFDCILGGSSDFPHKPDPTALQYLMERFGAAPDATLMVGDGPADYHVARNAGAHFCGLTCGILSAADFEELGANWVLDGVRQLLE